MKKALALAFLVTAAAAGPAHAQGSFDFSIPNIMRGPELYGRPPANPRWTQDGGWIYFQWVEPGTDYREPLKPYRVRAVAGSKPERVTVAHMDSVGARLDRGQRSADRKLAVVEFRGDIFVNDLVAGTSRALTQTVVRESSPQFSTDGSDVLFVREGNVYALSPATGSLRQLTDLRAGTAPADSAAPVGQRGRLAQQQRELFDVVRDRLRTDSVNAAEAKAAAERLAIRPIYLGRNQQPGSISIAPNGRAVMVTASSPGGSPRRAEVPRFVTESGYVENQPTYPLVGETEGVSRMAFIPLPGSDVRWLRVFPDSATGTVTAARWNRSGTGALFAAYTTDNKDMRIHSITGDGTLATVESVRDSAWVGGPCNGCYGWLDRDARVWFVSERDGYAHLYSASPDGSDRRQLTQGKWEVLSVELSADGRFFYLRTNEGSPFDEHFYRMATSGGPRERLTVEPGRHVVALSPDEQWGADVYSFVNRPPELFLMKLAPAGGTREAVRPPSQRSQLTTSPTAEWLAFPWLKPEIVNIPASDGMQVPAHIYRPSDMNAQPNGAAVIFVHGAGYLHNVGNFWSEYPREYMFNQYLASRGYVVLDLDFRASSGYGRDWRTAIYRHMGGRDLQDQVDASKYLAKEFGIDPERVGLYGGSYGGFITLMALFTEPKHFGAGAALRSVTDWAHYNHGYTSNILNLPQQDTLAYRRSSPIYFAEGLEDPLLMLHGMVDTNVHFQDIVRLTQRLIELGKTDWDLAVYPVEDHAFVRPSSWTDEYRRIFALFERSIGRRR